MTYSLAVVNGDLVAHGSNLGIVWGIDKLKQDLMLAVTERYGGDRFDPQMGSILQDFVGSVIDSNTQAAIQDEMLRVLDNYCRIQMDGFRSNPTRYSMSELLAEVGDIVTSLNFDTVQVAVAVRSAANDTATVAAIQGA